MDRNYDKKERNIKKGKRKEEAEDGGCIKRT